MSASHSSGRRAVDVHRDFAVSSCRANGSLTQRSSPSVSFQARPAPSRANRTIPSLVETEVIWVNFFSLAMHSPLVIRHGDVMDHRVYVCTLDRGQLPMFMAPRTIPGARFPGA